MTKGMGADRLRQTGTLARHLDGLVDDAGVHVMATGDAQTRVAGQLPGGEDVRPAPGLGARPRLPSQCMGLVRLACPEPNPLMLRLDPSEVILSTGVRGTVRWSPVLVPLTRTDGQWLQRVDVLDLSRAASMMAAAPVEPFGHQLGGAIHEREHGGDCFTCHDHRDVDLLVGAPGIDAALHSVVEDAFVKEHQGIHRLVPGRSCDVSMHGQVGQERLDHGFGRGKVVARPHAVETDEA